MQALGRYLSRPATMAKPFLQNQVRQFSQVKQAQTFVQRWDTIREEALLGGGQARIDKHHAQHKLTARERIELLFDQGSFIEYD